MTFAVNVQGGTGAGLKRPLKERWWTHSCCATRPATAAEIEAAEWPGNKVMLGVRMLSSYSCPDCGTRRPT